MGQSGHSHPEEEGFTGGKTKLQSAAYINNSLNTCDSFLSGKTAGIISSLPETRSWMSGNGCMNDEGGDEEDAGCTTGGAKLPIAVIVHRRG